MVHSFLFAPFADADRQEQFEAVDDALRAEVGAPTTLLLGNAEAAGAPVPVDAVVLQPGRMVLLVLVPHSGHLQIPALEQGAWHLSDQLLPSFGNAGNPFAFYQEHRASLLAWIGEQLEIAPTDLPPLTGIVVLKAPVTYGPEVESQLSGQSEAHNFQLVSDPSQLPRRLRQLPTASDAPSEADLEAWAARLEDDHWAAELAATEAEPSYGFWEQHARRLWLWLGAADVPADPPYGSSPASDPRQLEALRRELQAELQQQQRAAQARDAAREQELAQLRQQLAQTPDHQRAAQQERAALEEALRTARTESEARNKELDARIQQLGQLIGQLRTQAAQAPAVVKPASSTVAPQPKLPPKTVRRLTTVAVAPKLRWPRVALVVSIMFGLGLGSWALLRLSKNYLAARVPKREHRAQRSTPATQSSDDMSYYSPDESAFDTDTALSTEPLPPETDTLVVQHEPLIMHDSKLIVNDSKLIMQVPSDSAAKAAEQEESATPDSVMQ